MRELDRERTAEAPLRGIGDDTTALPRPSPRRRLTIRVLVGLFVVASFAFWAYALSGAARRTPPDTLSDQAFAAFAEPVCDEAVQRLEQLPTAASARDAAERSVTLRQATGLLRDMVRTLGSRP
ncbi:MAG: hypothetical protein OEY23_17325, partial [Acidimicrobiia bacterium]|nr:hypothetical protein [Acidimicrobiia bacterium]